MKRIELVREILNESAHGEQHSLIGLIHYIHFDLGYPVDRLLPIAERLFGIEKKFAARTLINLEITL